MSVCCFPWTDLWVWQREKQTLNGIHFLSILSCEEINYTYVSQKYLWVFKSSFFPLSFLRWKYFCLIDQHLPLWDSGPRERCREVVWGLSAHFNLISAIAWELLFSPSHGSEPSGWNVMTEGKDERKEERNREEAGLPEGWECANKTKLISYCFHSWVYSFIDISWASTMCQSLFLA